MGLPEWAERAFRKYEPAAGFDADPDPEMLAWWQQCKDRFERRWGDIAPEKWKVPVDAPCYAELRRLVAWEPADFVRECILETAVDLAAKKRDGNSPDKVAPAVKELDSLNDQIATKASELAYLFRQRDTIRNDHHIHDTEELTILDPFRFLDAFEGAIRVPRVRRWEGVAHNEIQAFLQVARSQSREKPEWPDLLDQISSRMPRPAAPTYAADTAIKTSRTKATKWSPWGVWLLGALDEWNEFPSGFLRECLGHGHLATLAEVALDAPAGAFNESQMKELRKRYAARLAE